ncbi:MAG: GtrA family protein, partial [Sporichthyaceae bacterium]
MSRVRAALRGSLFGEMARFGAVGVVALAVDVAGFNLLRFAGGEGPLYDRPLTAKVLSVTASTTVAYIGNRLWTFRHQRSSAVAVHREFALFVLFSAIALGIAVACLAVSHYVLGLTSPLADNIAANVVGLGLA